MAPLRPHHLDGLMTAAEVAELFGVHPKTVRKWAAAGVLPSVLEGRRRWYRVEDVEAALDAS